MTRTITPNGRFVARITTNPSHIGEESFQIQLAGREVAIPLRRLNSERAERLWSAEAGRADFGQIQALFEVLRRRRINVALVFLPVFSIVREVSIDFGSQSH